jgi:hypothetical protein
MSLRSGYAVAANKVLAERPAAVPVHDAVVRVYAELTGLDIVSVSKGTRLLEDEQQTAQHVAIFECRQSGRGGGRAIDVAVAGAGAGASRRLPDNPCPRYASH